ncbi:hypothetical protein H0H87_010633 [Tephrocybe sp. NHM501043]|nr:hypothetical protein H0H87_010633 [Tephrocybe sp. NHM501043]
MVLSASPTELGRVVRFDSECVLIPEPSKRSKPMKTYSLPLWKKRSTDAEVDAASSSSRSPPSPEVTHVVFKVPIPRASLPLTTCTIPKQDALTVPLRPCCAACVSITEESFNEGDEWQEKFSRGARRRRSASLDNGDNFSLDATRSIHSAGFGALSAQMDFSPGTRYKTSAFALTVDEVDRRRKSQEFTDEDVMRFRSASPRSSAVFHSPTGHAAASYPLTYRAADKDASTSSTSSSISATSDLDVPPRRPKSSPIQEEDEDQLFPLPSPRRTPNGSPASSVVPSPSPSPSASTSCLAPPTSNYNGLKSGSDEVLTKSLSRKSSNASLQPSALSLTIPDRTPVDRVRSATSPGTSPKPSLSINTQPEPHTRADSVPTPLPAVPKPVSPVEARGRVIPIPISPKSPRSPTMSPPKTRRPSFSLPAIKDAIKGASVDVLKGVSSMGGGAVTGL